MNIYKLWRLLRHYTNHPIGRLDKAGTLARITRWQIGTRILGMEVAAPFINGTRLLVQKGMHGATGNIYVGLMEFEDMAFVLHVLRKEDVFIDVGANVGVYSLLAASRGAQVLAIEPVPETYNQLLDNININRFQNCIDPMNIGVGRGPGRLHFSTQMGPTNHVIPKGEELDNSVTVKVNSLDEMMLKEKVTMIKIDVEGYEKEVLDGSTHLLKLNTLQAVLIELNGLGTRYGFNDEEIHAQLTRFGFVPVDYQPFHRKLNSLELCHKTGNTLYVRQPDELEHRLNTARPIIWNQYKI